MIKDISDKTKKIIKNSFKNAWNGKEKLSNVFGWWGVTAYLVCYLILQPLIEQDFHILIDKLLSAIIVIYFVFHITLIKKNSPKKPKLTKAQKKEIKVERQKDRTKRVIRKLLLKEPLTKWRPALVFGAIDLFIITTYIGYIV